MNEPTLIDDVRAAKQWMDEACSDLDALGRRLRVVETEYLARTGNYANVPTARPEWVEIEIAAAAQTPGKGLIDEIRTGR